MDLGIKGKRVLVTGGTRGIGRSIVLEMARAGADVVTCYRQEGEVVESLRRELKETGGNHHVVAADVADPAGVDALVEECRRKLGGLDVVVNNAGVISHVPFGELPLQEWERVVGVNLTGSFLVLQKSLALLGEGASIVNVGSRAATSGIPLRAHYTASKAGMIGLTRSLAKELGRRGIRVNLVAPGVIDTSDEDLSDAEREQYAQRYLHLVGLGRFGKPAEIAGATLFLAGDLSTYVTGEVLHVDGGM